LDRSRSRSLRNFKIFILSRSQEKKKICASATLIEKVEFGYSDILIQRGLKKYVQPKNLKPNFHVFHRSATEKVEALTWSFFSFLSVHVFTETVYFICRDSLLLKNN
jgi:hypothetical protein